MVQYKLGLWTPIESFGNVEDDPMRDAFVHVILAINY